MKLCMWILTQAETSHNMLKTPPVKTIEAHQDRRQAAGGVLPGRGQDEAVHLDLYRPRAPDIRQAQGQEVVDDKCLVAACSLSAQRHTQSGQGQCHCQGLSKHADAGFGVNDHFPYF